MSRIVLTDAEIIAVAAEVRRIIRNESKGVSELEKRETLDGIASMPVLLERGGVRKMVVVDVNLLAQPSWDAVKELVIRLEKGIDKVEGSVLAAETATKSAQEATIANNRAEGLRATAEESRVNAETSRVSVEKNRVEAENVRVSTEENRVQAETSRQTNTQQAITNANKAKDNANSEASRAKQFADNPSKIGENGNWWKWDETSGAYLDTGTLAKGGVMYPTFEINTDDMCLYMNYQDEIAVDRFELVEGNLIFKIK